MRRSDVILLVDLTNRIKEEMGMELPEAVDVVNACLPATVQEAKFWMLPIHGGSPHVSDSEPGELTARYFDSKWWLLRRPPIDALRQDPVDAIHEMALLRVDAEDLVRRVREHLGDPTQVPDSRHGYMDPSHPRYSAKLAATVRAWQAVADEGKTSVKQALEGWLREHADEFGLTNEGIKQCSKVANWQPLGGAPKTPTV